MNNKTLWFILLVSFNALLINACCKDKHTTIPISFTGKLRYMTDSALPQNYAIHYLFTYDSATGILKKVYLQERRAVVELKPEQDNKIEIVFIDSMRIDTIRHLTCFLTPDKKIQKITLSETNSDTTIFRCVYKSNGKVDSIYETDLSFLQQNRLFFNFIDSAGNNIKNNNSENYTYNSMPNNKYSRFLYAPGFTSSLSFTSILSFTYLLGINGYYTLPPNKNLISGFTSNNSNTIINLDYTFNTLNQIVQIKLSNTSSNFVNYTKMEYY